MNGPKRCMPNSLAWMYSQFATSDANDWAKVLADTKVMEDGSGFVEDSFGDRGTGSRHFERAAGADREFKGYRALAFVFQKFCSLWCAFIQLKPQLTEQLVL
jgi:hypothetical protein